MSNASAALLFTGLVVAACAGAPRERVVPELVAEQTAPERPPRALDEDGNFYVETDDPTHPRVRYLDGQLALDGSCAIKIGNKLSRKVPPVYVNGQPIGFC